MKTINSILDSRLFIISIVIIPFIIGVIIGHSDFTSLEPNRIGIDGKYRDYTNLDYADKDTIQEEIDKNHVAAAITTFDPNDDQTTYFGGHNPGIFSYMDGNIEIGTAVTVSDANGTPYEYIITDKAEIDKKGNTLLKTLDLSASSIYNYGSNEESIIIQFCNADDDLMQFWYGKKE